MHIYIALYIYIYTVDTAGLLLVTMASVRVPWQHYALVVCLYGNDSH